MARRIGEEISDTLEPPLMHPGIETRPAGRRGGGRRIANIALDARGRNKASGEAVITWFADVAARGRIGGNVAHYSLAGWGIVDSGARRGYLQSQQ